jgi:AcrR family transcriptional regulator
MTDDAMVFDVDQSRTRLEPDERKEQILAAAQAVFARHPYDTVNLNDIADMVGMTRTNIYYYFRTKRNLFLEVVLKFSRIPSEPEVAGPDGGSPRARVDAVLGRWLDVVDSNREMFMTMMLASSSSDPKVSGVLADSMRAWEQRLITITGMDLDDPTHHAMVRSYQAMVSAATVAWLEQESLTKAQVHRMLTEGLLALGRSVGTID